jgi:hypothetical protein
MNRQVWISVTAMLFALAGGPAQDSSRAQDAAARLDCMSRDMGGGTFLARGSIDLPVPPQSAFTILTDYERLPTFITAMDSSRVLQRDSTGVLVRQIGTAALVVPRRVRIDLRFTEDAPRILRFEIASGDFPVYYGSWKLDPAPPGSRLVYTLTMKPPSFIPQFIVRPFVERLLCRTLRQVRAECQRRS